MEQFSAAARIKGLTFKKRNDRRIAVGLHRDGLRELLPLFNISPDTIEKVIAEAGPQWANLSVIERSYPSQGGYTHFAIIDPKPGSNDG